MPVLKSIQYLRGLAALAVVLYHALQWTTAYGRTTRGFEAGGAGVDLFFVISGFVMWAITANSPVGPLTFIKRRLLRIGPPYWIATLAALAMAVRWPDIFQEVRVGGPAHTALSLLFLPHEDPRGAPFPLLQPGWTLEYEVLFYGIFAMGLMLPGRWRIGWIALALASAWLVGEIWRYSYVFIANPLGLEFLGGVLLAEGWRRGLLRSRRWSLVVIGWALGWLSLLEWLGYRPEFWRPLLWGAPALAIVGAAVAFETAGAGRPMPALGALGDASYSIYLWHWLVFMPLVRLAGMPAAPIFVIEALVVAIAAGFAGRSLIEKPLLESRGLRMRDSPTLRAQ